MLDCVVYISSVAHPKKHSRKIECLENFAEGVKALGKNVVVDWSRQYYPARLAVILGWVTTNTGGQNIALRHHVISEQQRHGLKTMCIDASCFKYLDNYGSYLRYSIGGPFYDRAEYANKNSDGSKWQEISQKIGVRLEPQIINNNGYILICMQRDGGFSMKGMNPIHWLHEKIQLIRTYSSRSIAVRPHPGQYSMQDFKEYMGKHGAKLNVTVIDPAQSSLISDLKNAYAAVFFNSSASVAAVCQGVPIFVDDQSCVSWDMANKNLADILNPRLFDRTQWINDLSAAHWSDADGRTGRIWQKFSQFIS